MRNLAALQEWLAHFLQQPTVQDKPIPMNDPKNPKSNNFAKSANAKKAVLHNDTVPEQVKFNYYTD